MIPLRVSVTYTPRLTRGEQALLALPNRLRNLRPLMKGVIAPAVNRMLKRHWDSKGAAFGRRWAAWAAATLRKRTAKGNAAKGLLLDEEHLFKVIFRARPADDRLRMIDGGLRLSLNVGVPYAIFHQVGTENMTERQVIPDPLPGRFITEVRDLVRQFILSGRVTDA